MTTLNPIYVLVHDTIIQRTYDRIHVRMICLDIRIPRYHDYTEPVSDLKL